jgi:hypothetical protein
MEKTIALGFLLAIAAFAAAYCWAALKDQNRK